MTKKEKISKIVAAHGAFHFFSRTKWRIHPLSIIYKVIAPRTPVINGIILRNNKIPIKPIKSKVNTCLTILGCICGMALSLNQTRDSKKLEMVIILLKYYQKNRCAN